MVCRTHAADAATGFHGHIAKTIEMAMPRIFLLITFALIFLAMIARRRQLQT
ncbi:MAG: hypothetical protein ACRD4K_06730 [Candidatus Acidiferrales bacterium]